MSSFKKTTHFAYPCVTELRSILSSLPWPANRNICVSAEQARPRGSQFHNAVGVGPTVPTAWVCAARSWWTLWGNSPTCEQCCIQCNTDCHTAAGRHNASHCRFLFLGAVVILKKVTISPVLPACLPACLSICPSAWNNSAPTGWIFMKFSIWWFFENLLRKLKFDYNPTRKKGAHYTKADVQLR